MDVELFICPDLGEDISIPEVYKSYLAGAARDLEAWKEHLIQVLEDSGSEERKFLRWKVYIPDDHGTWVKVEEKGLEEGELEVGLDTPRHNKGSHKPGGATL